MKDSVVRLAAKRRKVAVFGGDGFIGSHFVDQLLAHGHELTVFDRFSGGWSKNLAHAEGRFRKVAGDIGESELVAEALDGQEVAAYFICSTTPGVAWNHALPAIETEIRNFIHFLELCVEAGVRKVIFASSGGMVYGPRQGPSTEDTAARPVNPYGIAKLGQEHLLGFYLARHGIAADIYRIGNAYGPRQSATRGQGVVSAWIECALAGEDVDVYGDDSSIRDYVFVHDVARLMTYSFRNLDSSGTFNLGTGVGTSITDLLKMFGAILDRPLPCRKHPRRPADATVSILPSVKLRRHFPGFKFLELEQGLRRTYAWARAVRLLHPAPGTTGKQVLASKGTHGLHRSAGQLDTNGADALPTQGTDGYERHPHHR